MEEKNSIYNKKINPITKKSPEIGVDTTDDFFKDILQANGLLNATAQAEISTLEQSTMSRDSLYQTYDVMAEDATISGALEIYAEDATETNDSGEIVWVESSNLEAQKYVNYLIKTLCINKHIYGWVYSLIKYGDLYVRLFREEPAANKTLNESLVEINQHNDTIKYANYVEMVPNPSTIFELVKHGQSQGYVETVSSAYAPISTSLPYITNHRYSFRKKDVNIYPATDFVHASLQHSGNRFPEYIELTGRYKKNTDLYQVRSGQSLLYSTYKVWRQLSLLEDSLLLNRLTKSSILRLIELQVGDTPEDKIAPTILRLRGMFEQRAALNVGDSISNYTNPGPMENTVIIPTRGDRGSINVQQVGGDVNVKDIADIEYYRNKELSSLRIPKQYLQVTDDSTGFNGGTSLSLASSRAAKTIKNIQATVCQMITDMINIFLVSRGLSGYINQFTIRMQEPITQEALDKRESESNKLDSARNVLDLVDNYIEDEQTKLKIVAELLSKSITNTDVITSVNEYVQKKEDEIEELKKQEEENNTDSVESDQPIDNFNDFDIDFEKEIEEPTEEPSQSTESEFTAKE